MPDGHGCQLLLTHILLQAPSSLSNPLALAQAQLETCCWHANALAVGKGGGITGWVGERKLKLPGALAWTKDVRGGLVLMQALMAHGLFFLVAVWV